MNINRALEIAEEAAAQHYLNGADLEDILRAALEGVGPWIAAQTLRESAKHIDTYAKVAYEQGVDDEARGYIVARGILTDRAEALEKS